MGGAMALAPMALGPLMARQHASNSCSLRASSSHSRMALSNAFLSLPLPPPLCGGCAHLAHVRGMCPIRRPHRCPLPHRHCAWMPRTASRKHSPDQGDMCLECYWTLYHLHPVLHDQRDLGEQLAGHSLHPEGSALQKTDRTSDGSKTIWQKTFDHDLHHPRIITHAPSKYQ